jgi:hypothetical protein
MEFWLQLLGSAASIVSIPLAVYLYIRSQEAQYRRVREEVARSLSYQIGDGRKLSAFEIQAVIDSQSRQNRIRRGKILADEIVEDLVTDTIRNPMIASERKEEIIGNLRDVHSKSAIFAVLTRSVIDADFLKTVSSDTGQLDLVKLRDRILEVKKDKPKRDLRLLARISNVFLIAFVGLCFSVVTIVYVFFPEFWRESYSWPQGKSVMFGLFVSFGCSAVAAAIAFVYRILAQRYLDK